MRQEAWWGEVDEKIIDYVSRLKEKSRMRFFEEMAQEVAKVVLRTGTSSLCW